MNDRDTWLAERRKGLGASDIPIILGQSPWGSPFTVWAHKTHDDLPEAEPTDAMLWGQRLEDSILDGWCADNGYIVRTRQPYLIHAVHDWMRATPDAIVWTVDDPDRNVVAEVKTHGWSDDWEGEHVPQYVTTQVQWQMLVGGYDRAVVIAFDKVRTRMDTYWIDADPAYQTHLFDFARAWWERHVIGGEPPDVTATDTNTLADLYPTSVESTVEVDADMVADLRAARVEFDAAKARKEAAEARLKSAMAEADTAVADGRVVATWKTQHRRGYEVAPSTLRVLRLKKEET